MTGMRTLPRPPHERSELLEGTAYADLDVLFDAEPAGPRIDQRFVERRESVARAAFRARSRKQLVVGGLAVVLLLAAVVAKSGLFAVRVVDVAGAAHSDPDLVRRVASIHGQPSMFALDEGEVASRVATLPWVQSAKVVRHFPNRVEILVQEYSPVAVAVAGSEMALVASDDRVLARVVTPPASLPRITGVTAIPRDGEPLRPDGAATVAERLPASMRSNLVSIEVGEQSGVVVKLTDVDVRLGRLTDLDLKLRAAATVLANADACRKYVDVSVPLAPVAGC